MNNIPPSLHRCGATWRTIFFCYLSQWHPNTLTKLSVEVQPVPLKYKCWNPSWSKCILRIIFVHVALAPTLFVFPCQRSQFSPNEPEKQVAKAPNWFQTKQDFPNGSFLKRKSGVVDFTCNLAQGQMNPWVQGLLWCALLFLLLARQTPDHQVFSRFRGHVWWKNASSAVDIKASTNFFYFSIEVSMYSIQGPLLRWYFLVFLRLNDHSKDSQDPHHVGVKNQ